MHCNYQNCCKTPRKDHNYKEFGYLRPEFHACCYLEGTKTRSGLNWQIYNVVAEKVDERL